MNQSEFLRDAPAGWDPSRWAEEIQFHRLVDAVVDCAIFLIDPRGIVKTWNPGAERLKGYRASEVIGRHFSILYPPEDQDTPAHALQVAAEEGRFETENWRLRIGGAVENPRTWTLQEFHTLPQEDFVSDIHCVTQWSRFDNRWRGVSSKTILEIAKPKPEVSHVVFHSYDGYTTNVKLSVFAEANVLLAHSWEGAPIPREHGGPVRVVIPDWYFWKSAKWVTRIEFVATDQPGFWEVRGYHNEGDPWKEERYS